MNIPPLFLANESDTQVFGARLAERLTHHLLNRTQSRSGLIVTLEGDLGAGKTTLVRSCLRALGVQGAIKSPTYTLLEPYQPSNERFSQAFPHGLKIAHLDLYRLVEPEELDYIGGRHLRADYALAFIEWPNKGHGYLAAPDIKIQLNHKDRGREVSIESGLDGFQI